MSKIILALAIILTLGSCAKRFGDAPRNLDDACAIVNERPSYLRAFKAAERKYGVQVPVLMAMIYQESKC